MGNDIVIGLIFIMFGVFVALMYFSIKSQQEKRRLIKEKEGMRRLLIYFPGSIIHEGKLGYDGKALLCIVAFVAIGAVAVAFTR